MEVVVAYEEGDILHVKMYYISYLMLVVSGQL